MTITQSISVSGNVTLDLNGHVLQYKNDSTKGSVFVVEDGGHLTIQDSNASRLSHRFTPNGDGLWVPDEENGTISAGVIAKDGRITGFTAGRRSLDRIDCKGLNLRVTVEKTELSLSPAALRQLLEANVGSLTLDMAGIEMTLTRELLRGIEKQLNGKDLDISLVSGEDALSGLSTV